MRKLIPLVILGLIAAPLAVAAANHRVGTDENGVILNGYDAVAYFTMNKAVKGSDKYTVEHDGAIYRFSSAANRNLFAKDPEKYAPQFGGWCAYGVSLGKKFMVDGKAFAVLDGKLYVNLDRSVQKKWEKDRAKFLHDADQKWPQILDKSAKEIN